jgi:hypothetical protein
MKYPILGLTYAISVCCVVSARTWTNSDGRAIEADLVKLDGVEVVLQKDGKEYRVPLESLSEEDQRFAKEESGKTSADTETGTKPAEASPFPLKIDQWVSGEKIDPADAQGRPIVLHQWQAHCGRCPSSLEDFEKMARRKKSSGALFMIWHSYDKVELAKEKSDDLDLDLPVYHGKAIKWDGTFGKPIWPHVVVMKPDGKVVYMGEPNRDFNKALDEHSAK